MSVESNKATMRRFYQEIGNQGNMDLVDEIVAEDFVDHGGFPGLPHEGREAIRALFGASHTGFTGFHMTVDDMFGEGEEVVARIRVSGTHTGEFGGIPPTNKSIEVNAIDIFEFRDGEITQSWAVADRAGMMQQLGLAPEM